jgi:ribosome-associated translation inhibitor RaiA
MKTSDQAGNVALRIFDYTERGTTQPMQTQQQPQPDFQEAIDKLDDKFQRQINRLNSIIGNLRKDGVING